MLLGAHRAKKVLRFVHLQDGLDVRLAHVRFPQRLHDELQPVALGLQEMYNPFQVPALTSEASAVVERRGRQLPSQGAAHVACRM